MMMSQEELVTGPVIHKEKKKVCSGFINFSNYMISIIFVTKRCSILFFGFQGIFSSFSSNKEKHVPPVETEDSRESIQELSVIFSKENFPSIADNNDNLAIDEDEVELNIGMKESYKCSSSHEQNIMKHD